MFNYITQIAGTARGSLGIVEINGLVFATILIGATRGINPKQLLAKYLNLNKRITLLIV